MQLDFTSTLLNTSTPFPAATVERFWAKVNKTDTCWLWTGFLFAKGYGGFTSASKTVKAHRFSYELHIGPIPTGLFVCHHCDTPACVNPDHLFVGTHTDNMRDMRAKGRQSKCGGTSTPKKLCADQVQEIRNAYNSGLASQRQLARRYKVSQSLICDICRRRWWKHV